ncbi:MAG: hypothetical protein R1F52_00585 [Candidatus Nitrosoabyssus spongiisocia]|nr:MAG: hypothetical protein R1F52_00585 [Nitrosopumilaceae archaeon AB1(1)]
MERLRAPTLPTLFQSHFDQNDFERVPLGEITFLSSSGQFLSNSLASSTGMDKEKLDKTKTFFF